MARRADEMGVVVIVIVFPPIVTTSTLDAERCALATGVVRVSFEVG